MQVDGQQLQADQMSHCWSYGSINPSSQSRKISIGVMVDSTLKKHSKASNQDEDQAVVQNTKRVKSDIKKPTEGKNKKKMAIFNKKIEETETMGPVTSPGISPRTFHEKTPTSENVLHAEETYNAPASVLQHKVDRTKNTPSTHSVHFFTYEEMGRKDGDTYKVQEVRMSDKEVVGDKMDSANTRTASLKMKLQEILGNVSSPNDHHSMSPTREEAARGLSPGQKLDQMENTVVKPRQNSDKAEQKYDKGCDTIVKPVQNSDTIETDSEVGPDQGVSRPVTRSLTKKRVPTKSQKKAAKFDRTSSSKVLQEKSMFSFEELPRGSQAAVFGGSSKSAQEKSVKKRSITKPHKIRSIGRDKSDKIKQAAFTRETPPPSHKTSSLVDFHGDLPKNERTQLGSQKTKQKKGYCQSPQANMRDEQGKLDSLGNKDQQEERGNPFSEKIEDLHGFTPDNLRTYLRSKKNIHKQYSFKSPRTNKDPRDNFGSPGSRDQQADISYPFLKKTKDFCGFLSEKERINLESKRNVQKQDSHQSPMANKRDLQDKQEDNADPFSKKIDDFDGCLPQKETKYLGRKKNIQIQGSHQSSLANKRDQQENFENPVKRNQQDDIRSPFLKNVRNLDGDFQSPTFGMRTPVSSPCTSPVLETDNAQCDKNPALEEEIFNVGGYYSLSTLKNLNNYGNGQIEFSDDSEELQDSPVTTTAPHKEKKNMEGGPSLSSSEFRGSGTSVDASPTYEGCREDDTFSPGTYCPEKMNFMFHPTKMLRNHENVELNDISTISPSAKGTGETSWIPETLENPQEDGLARAVELFALALEKLKRKVKSVTSKKSSEILMSVSEGIHLQLQNVESQIQTDLGKMTSVNKLKRKRVETRFEEQQEQLKLIHEKFKEEVNQHIQECRSTFEAIEEDQLEIKGTVEKQKASHVKLFVQAQEANETLLSDAQKRIKAVHESAREKMLQLKQVIALCLKERILS